MRTVVGGVTGAMVRLLYVGRQHHSRCPAVAGLGDLASDIAITSAGSAKRALELLAAKSFDCILCETDLGDLMGLQLLGAIRERGIGTTTILLISEGEEELASEAMRSGADDYFRKVEGGIASELLFNSIVRRLAAAKDRTTRLEVEDALRESEERYRIIAEFTSDWICWLGPDRRLIYISPSCEAITGYKPKDFFEDSDLMLNIIHPDDRARFVHHLDHEEKHAGDDSLAFRIMRADGEERWLSHVCSPITDADGRYLGRRGSNRDITKWKRTEEELRESRNKLQRQAELLTEANKELEAFAFTTSHDLQAPLRRMSGWIKLLLTDYSSDLNEECRRYLALVDENSKEMRRLFDAILRFSRSMRSELKHEKVDLTTIAKVIVKKLQSEEPKRAVECVIAEGVAAEGDNDLMMIVMENLLSNAWKYTSRTDKPKIEFGSIDEGDERAYFVRDNGIGFDPEKSHKLFNAFQRLHSEKDFVGIGVGLASVRRIVLRHGGRVWAEGREGQGATFYFTLS